MTKEEFEMDLYIKVFLENQKEGINMRYLNASNSVSKFREYFNNDL